MLSLDTYFIRLLTYCYHLNHIILSIPNGSPEETLKTELKNDFYRFYKKQICNEMISKRLHRKKILKK